LAKGAHINRDYDLTDLFSAGAIISNLPDLAKWNAALDGTGLLGEASKQQWWTPAELANNRPKDYGFGWFLEPLNGHRCVGHGGATSGFSATIQRFPDDQLSVIILTNADETGLATAIAKEVAPLYFKDAGAK
jgi:CubicO group peptidase (beta-lactamase class C family)